MYPPEIPEMIKNSFINLSSVGFIPKQHRYDTPAAQRRAAKKLKTQRRRKSK